MTVIGIERKEGTFKNEAGKEVAYCTTYLHLCGTNEDTFGQCTACYKVGRNCEIVGAEKLIDLVGHEVILAKSKTQYGTTVDGIFVRE